MQTPLEQILSSLDGLTTAHFIPVLIVGIPVLITSYLRRGKPKTHRWVKGRGFVSELELSQSMMESPDFEDKCRKLNMSEDDIKKLRASGRLG